MHLQYGLFFHLLFSQSWAFQWPGGGEPLECFSGSSSSPSQWQISLRTYQGKCNYNIDLNRLICFFFNIYFIISIISITIIIGQTRSTISFFFSIFSIALRLNKQNEFKKTRFQNTGSPGRHSPLMCKVQHICNICIFCSSCIFCFLQLYFSILGGSLEAWTHLERRG